MTNEARHGLGSLSVNISFFHVYATLPNKGSGQKTEQRKKRRAKRGPKQLKSELEYQDKTDTP